MEKSRWQASSRAIKAWATENVADDTTALAAIIAEAMPNRLRSKLKHHPATRTFQALRIAVNDELGALERLLAAGLFKARWRALIVDFTLLKIDSSNGRSVMEWSQCAARARGPCASRCAETCLSCSRLSR